MKIMLLSIAFSIFSLKSFSQDSLASVNNCEQREARLIETMNSFSAGFLYNTYALIGTIFDGFQSDFYDGGTSFDLLNAQKKMIDNMIPGLERSLENNLFKEDVTRNYMTNYIAVLKGLGGQIDMLQKIVKNNTKKNIEVYLGLRNSSWKQINALMGIKD